MYHLRMTIMYSYVVCLIMTIISLPSVLECHAFILNPSTRRRTSTTSTTTTTTTTTTSPLTTAESRFRNKVGDCIVPSLLPSSSLIIMAASTSSSSTTTTTTAVSTTRNQQENTSVESITATNSTTTEASSSSSSNSSNSTTNLRTIWDHVWVPNGERRNKIKTLIQEMEQDHIQQWNQYYINDDDDVSSKNKKIQTMAAAAAAATGSTSTKFQELINHGLDILVQWAQLGEGPQCYRWAQQLWNELAIVKDMQGTLPPIDEHDETEQHELLLLLQQYHMKIHRRVLHAQYNQFQRIAWNGNTKTPKFTMTNAEISMGWTVLQSVEETLHHMEQSSRDYHVIMMKTTKGRTAAGRSVFPLMDATDYAPLLYGYNQLASATTTTTTTGRSSFVKKKNNKNNHHAKQQQNVITPPGPSVSSSSISISAIAAMRRLSDLYRQTNYTLDRLAPTLSMYIAVCKCILNDTNEQHPLYQTNNDNNENNNNDNENKMNADDAFVQRMGTTRPEMIHGFVMEYVNHMTQLEQEKQHDTMTDDTNSKNDDRNNNNNNNSNMNHRNPGRHVKSHKKTTNPIQLFNVALDAWSKVMPPPSFNKQQREEQAFNFQNYNNNYNNNLRLNDDDVDERQEEQKAMVISRVNELWSWMPTVSSCHDTNEPTVVVPTTKTYTCMMYAYTKSGDLNAAYELIEPWKKTLLPTTTNTTTTTTSNRPVRVDSRALRMLASAMAAQSSSSSSSTASTTTATAMVDLDNKEMVDTTATMRVQYAEAIEQIIHLLWDLDHAGYHDVAPDIYLYTTAVDAWAMAACSQSVPRAQQLVDDIKERYTAMKQVDETNDSQTITPAKTNKNKKTNRKKRADLLKPDIALYNALIKAIAKQPGLVNAADKAGSVVRSIVKGLESDSNGIRPDILTYNALIDACLASPDDVEKAEQTLDRMIATGSPRPNEKTFTSVIYGLLSATNAIPGGTARAEAWLDRMEERYLPRASLYETMILAWCQNEPVTGAMRAYQLLIRMEELFAASNRDAAATTTMMTMTSHNNRKKESLRPNRSLYSAVVEALEDQGEMATADIVRSKRDTMYGNALVNQKLRSNQQVFALLKDVDANLAGGVPSGNTYNFNQVLAQLANSGKIWSGLRAEDVLNFMLELTLKRQNRHATPNIVTFNTVMSAWAKSNHALAGEKAVEVMNKLDDLHDMGLLEDVVADRVTYNTLINAYAKSYDCVDSGRKAQEWFDKLREIYEKTGDKAYKPDLVSYSTLLSAWARSRDEDAAKRAEEILKQMHTEYTSNPLQNPKPDTVCFNQVLYAWARSPTMNASRRAEMVLHLMEDMAERKGGVVPDTKTYNIVLLALANSSSRDAPIRAMQLLNEMKQMKDGSKPDMVSYNTAISAFTKKGSVKAALKMLDDLLARDDLDLDTKFFTSLLYSLAETETKNAPSVAEDIVSKLMKKKSTGNDEAEALVTIDLVNALINVWGRSKNVDAPLRAQEILDELQSGAFASGTSASGTLKPNVVTYTLVIDIWAKSGYPDAPDRAVAVLDSMVTTKGGECMPNVQTYTAAIQAYARSKYRTKAKGAQSLLRRMKDDYTLNDNRDAEPSIYTYNAVLNAAEFTVGNEQDMESAFKVACETFDEVRSALPDQRIAPDHVTYGSFMGVISQLMPKSALRNDMVSLVFRRACVDGQVAPVVMKKFKEAAEKEQYRLLMGKVAEDNLPNEWTCNVRGARQ